MNMIFFEMKKSWFKFSFLFIFIILNIINFYKLFTSYTLYGSMGGEGMLSTKEAYYKLYEDKLKGEITESKIQYIVDNQRKYSNLEKSSQNNLSTLTGSNIFDNFIFTHIIVPDFEYAITYSDFTNEIANKSLKNIYFYTEHNNMYEVAVNKYIYNLYKNRKIENYFLTNWVETYFTYDFSSLLILIMIILGLSSTFSSEYESGMNNLFKAGNAYQKIVNYKIISACIYIVIITLFFTIFDLLITNNLCKIDGLNEPIYSAKFFKYSPFSCTIGNVILICFATKLLVFYVIGEITMIISLISKNSIVSICITFGIVSALITLTKENQSFFNPINLLSTYKLFLKFEQYNVGGIPILSLYFFIIIYFLICISLIIFIKVLTKERCKCCVKI